MSSIRPALYSLAVLSLYAKVGYSSTISYCSNQNAADAGTIQNDIYNSNGACEHRCQNYAFAVVQYQTCGCSNYIPADQASVGECNQQCPGFPPDKCGNSMKQLYGYIALGPPPSGTLGATPSPSAVQPPATDPTSSTVPPTTNYVSETVSVVISMTPTPETSVETSYVTPVPSTHTSVSTATVLPSPSVTVVYVSGAPVTQTVTSTPVIQPNLHPETITVERKTALSGGAVAGIVIGALLGVAAIVLAAFLLWRRRKNQDVSQTTDAAAGSGQRNPKRNVSVLSKTGLLARARPSMGERDHDEHNYYIPPLTSHGSIRQSMVLGLGGDAVETSSPLGGSQAGSDTRRHSKPFIYDQRLNPSALYANHDNGSRVSMQDNNDYSRPLGVTNPDTRPSFESHNSHQQ